jgi:AraC family transcriptional regulator
MSLLQAQRQRDLKYPTSTLLKSSGDMGWSTLFAELRSHSPYEKLGTAGPHVEVAFDGTWRPVRATTGTIWLRPAEAEADEHRLAGA